jgi:hypothetical protein
MISTYTLHGVLLNTGSESMAFSGMPYFCDFISSLRAASSLDALVSGGSVLIETSPFGALVTAGSPSSAKTVVYNLKKASSASSTVMPNRPRNAAIGL